MLAETLYLSKCHIHDSQFPDSFPANYLPYKNKLTQLHGPFSQKNSHESLYPGTADTSTCQNMCES